MTSSGQILDCNLLSSPPWVCLRTAVACAPKPGYLVHLFFAGLHPQYVTCSPHRLSMVIVTSSAYILINKYIRGVLKVGKTKHFHCTAGIPKEYHKSSQILLESLSEPLLDVTLAPLASFAYELPVLLFDLEGPPPRASAPRPGLLPKALHQGATESASSKRAWQRKPRRGDMGGHANQYFTSSATGCWSMGTGWQRAADKSSIESEDGVDSVLRLGLLGRLWPPSRLTLELLLVVEVIKSRL